MQEGEMIESFSYEHLNFDDGRGKYPEPLKAQAPLGTRAKIKRAAEKEGISAGELIRRAVFSYLDSNNSGRGSFSFGAGA
ncbi:hypothetical protein KBI52_12305 [Microvirga sp. HBU67558]|uniref:ribbon-helix-helix domain-containing protein n=1 Tax=Microvirga sp. HBU67558 TaxID=2824562 RepID=UPI001B3699B0|nr:CopG family transcriptional regulator [Microvirga sp. HBU67558]MBQ0820989.1 hypothetical protein [Microvirga sp. HBU67558]